MRSYLEVGNSPEYLYRLGLEYRCIADYLDGKYSSFEEFYNHLSQAIKRFAKRQMTWFKKIRQSIGLIWNKDTLNRHVR